VAERVSDSIDIEATAQEIYDVATDFETYPQWNENIKKAEVRDMGSDGTPLKVWFEVDAKVKTVRYTLEYDHSDAPSSFSWKLIDGDVRELSGSYVFDEFDDVTDVTYELTIDPGFPLPGVVRRQAERQIMRGALEDLKKRVESA
jgi:uncharacterized membrane protein